MGAGVGVAVGVGSGVATEAASGIDMGSGVDPESGIITSPSSGSVSIAEGASCTMPYPWGGSACCSVAGIIWIPGFTASGKGASNGSTTSSTATAS